MNNKMFDFEKREWCGLSAEREPVPNLKNWNRCIQALDVSEYNSHTFDKKHVSYYENERDIWTLNQRVIANYT